MKKQTYIKKLYALMTAMNQETPFPNCGRLLKSVQQVGFKTKNSPKVKSYAEAWEILKPIRTRYGM